MVYLHVNLWMQRRPLNVIMGTRASARLVGGIVLGPATTAPSPGEGGDPGRSFTECPRAGCDLM